MQDGEAYIAVSLRSRNWWRNLRGGRAANLRVAGKRYTVRGEVLEDHPAVVDALKQYFRQNPGYAKYFGVRLAPDGQPSSEDLDRAADTRHYPAQSSGRTVKSSPMLFIEEMG